MRKIPLFCVAAVLVMACEKPQQTPSPVPDPGPTPVVENKIPINISMLPFTKATDSAFESGDVVGLWVVNSGNNFTSSGNHADNVSLTFDGSSWKAASQLYWKDESTPASFYCYYPRVASVSDVKALPFSVKADQSALAEYRASDLLWGCKLNVTPTANAVEIQTHHRMSNLLVYLLPGNGYTAESLEVEGVELKINALKPACTLDAIFQSRQNRASAVLEEGRKATEDSVRKTYYTWAWYYMSSLPQGHQLQGKERLKQWLLEHKELEPAPQKEENIVRAIVLPSPSESTPECRREGLKTVDSGTLELREVTGPLVPAGPLALPPQTVVRDVHKESFPFRVQLQLTLSRSPEWVPGILLQMGKRWGGVAFFQTTFHRTHATAHARSNGRLVGAEGYIWPDGESRVSHFFLMCRSQLCFPELVRRVCTGRLRRTGGVLGRHRKPMGPDSRYFIPRPVCGRRHPLYLEAYFCQYRAVFRKFCNPGRFHWLGRSILILLL